MLQVRRSDWIQTQRELDSYFFELFIQPLIDVINTYYKGFYNSKSQVLSALRDGRISYSDGVFAGQFSAGISRTLSRFATFDGRSKVWVANPAKVPGDIKGAAVTANFRRENLVRDIYRIIDRIPERIAQTVETLTFPFQETFNRIDGQVYADISKITVVPNLSQSIRDNILRDYTQSQILNIKNWAPKEIERLRIAVEKVTLKGLRRNTLVDFIKREWDIKHNKAVFLAEQETSIFLSRIRRERATEAGLSRYKWSTSNDEKVRPAGGNRFTPGNNHRRLNNLVFTFGDPPVVDTLSGRRAEPGEDYRCRCVAILLPR